MFHGNGLAFSRPGRGLAPESSSPSGAGSTFAQAIATPVLGASLFGHAPGMVRPPPRGDGGGASACSPMLSVESALFVSGMRGISCETRAARGATPWRVGPRYGAGLGRRGPWGVGVFRACLGQRLGSASGISAGCRSESGGGSPTSPMWTTSCLWPRVPKRSTTWCPCCRER